MKKFSQFLLTIAISFIIFGCASSPKQTEQDQEAFVDSLVPVTERIDMPQRETEFDIIDYIIWRGDLTFKQSEFNEIDAAIFAQLTYIHFNDIVSSNFDDKKTLRQAAKEFEHAIDFEERQYNGPLINQKTVTLLKVAGQSERFGNIKLCNFKDEIDNDKEIQFSAFTAIYDDNKVIVAFRGTHQEIVGWKEDMNSSFEFPVPAQIRSVEYLDEVAKECKGPITLTGHSKGGNLALFSAAFCNAHTQKKLATVYNFDGQGFDTDILSIPEFHKVEPLIKTFIPQSSVVGMLFESIGQKRIIESNQKDILFQHDPFSWQVVGKHFVYLTERTKESLRIEKTLKLFLQKMDKEHRKSIVTSLFGIFEVSNSNTLKEFQENWFKSSPQIIRYMNSLDKEEKKDLNEAIQFLIQSYKESKDD